MKFFIFRWLIGLAVLALVLLGLGLDGLGDAFSQADLGTVAIVVLLDLPILLLVSLRSHLVLARLGHRVRPDVVFSTTTLGFVAGSLTPAAAGELLRVDSLRVQADVEARDGLALIVFERLLSFYLFVLAAMVSGAIVHLPLGWAIAVITGALVLAPIPLFMSSVLRRLPAANAEPLGWARKAIAYLRDLVARIERLTDAPNLMTLWSLTTLVMMALVALQFWLLCQSVGSITTYQLAWFALTGSQVVGIVSLLPFGIGVADASLVGILAGGGMSLDQALAVAVLVRVTITLPLILSAIGAYLYLLVKERSLQARKRGTQESVPPQACRRAA